jgi:hypothetical protein
MTNSDVRLAVPADEGALVELLADMHAETGFGRFDPEVVTAVVRAGIERNGGLVGVIKNEQEIEGTIGLFLGGANVLFGPQWCSRDPYIFDLWSFVAEPYRRSTHAKVLIQFAKNAALALQLPLMMTVVSNELTARKERLFERQMPRSGSLFMFNVPGAPAAMEAMAV